MNEVDKQYQNLLQEILEKGTTAIERTGTGTKSLFGKQIEFDMSLGLPAITTKKMFFKGIIGELLWFLGNHHNHEEYKRYPLDNIKYLLDNKINIWVGDCYKKYCNRVNPTENFSQSEFINEIINNKDFALNYGNIGAGYGWQWRNFGGDYMSYRLKFSSKASNSISRPNDGVDQILKVIQTLKTNPSDRRMIVSAWNPMDSKRVVLPPCHYCFSFYARELSSVEQSNLIKSKKYSENNVPKHALSLKWTQRSVDTMLGLPFNITSYAILLELIAKEVNMIPDKLIGSLENVHIYSNHVEAAKEQIARSNEFDLPRIKLADKSIFDMNIDDIEIVDYKSHEKIKAKLNN